ncbi:MAG: outer membrane beta-barrel protein, partial [Prevotella sp.]|nr:outer membrane beta-barrel protein [Prevotella sp.]
MKRKSFSLTILLLFISIVMMAQGKYSLKGVVVDHETGEPVVGATVQLLLQPNNTFVMGAAANEDGAFSFSGVEKKKFSLKITSVGYLEKIINLNMSEKKGHTIDLGYMTLNSDERMLSEVTVTANAAKVQASGDSLIFNASAYRTPEGSTLEALVKLLPGAEVDENGNITINGKTVSKILVDGKEFFLNDKEVAMKNIPVDMIEKLKTYEMKSDQARITGIDDGEEETVLDLSVKKGMKNGWFGNINGVAGTEHRYDSRGMVNRFNDNVQLSALASARNTPDRWGWNRANGLNSRKEIGGNFATTSEKLETGGSVKYNYSGSDRLTESSTEDFAAQVGKFGMRRNQSISSENRFETNAKIEWKPDTMTNILFRPNFTYSRNRGMSNNRSGSYNEDPNLISENDALGYNDVISEKLKQEDYPLPNSIAERLYDVIVNTNSTIQQTYSNNTNFNANLQINRKLNSAGRGITFRANGSVASAENKQLSAGSIVYNKKYSSRDPKVNNRYYKTPSDNYNLMGMLMYSEPIFDRTYLQFSYRYSYSYSKNDRQAQIYDSQAYIDLSNSLQANRYDIDAVLRFMDEAGHMLRRSDSLSQFSEYRNYNQNISLQIRRVRKEYNFNAGFDFMPQRTVLNYKYMGKEFSDITRNVFNIAPRVYLKYNFDKNTNLEFRYRGRSSQPSMTNLLDITDDSDQQNISKGNPGLKPSFSHSFEGNYHAYNPERQRGLWSWLRGEVTNNSIANKTTYDSNGVRTTMPMNVNGNWNVNAGVGMNTGLGEKKYFSVGGSVGGRYANNVGFYNNVKDASKDNADIKSITKNTNLNFGLNTSYRKDLINIELRGRMDYSHINNNVNPTANQNTYNYSYGTNLQFNFDWGMEIATDCNMSSRRGYSAAEMNTDELLWNASISQSFLKGKALTLKAEIFDILGKQTNISRVVNAFTRNDSRNNAIYQYAMFSAIFRFSVFAGKNTMGTDQERKEERRGWRR